MYIANMKRVMHVIRFRKWLAVFVVKTPEVALLTKLDLLANSRDYKRKLNKCV